MDSTGNPNVLLRKKYFVSANTVFLQKKAASKRRSRPVCKIIDSTRAKLSSKPIRIPLAGETAESHQAIDVKVIKDGAKIKSLIITCPCGRSTTLDCEYAT